VAQTVHLDEAAEASRCRWWSLCNADGAPTTNCRALHGLGLMLQPLMAQLKPRSPSWPSTARHAIEDFTAMRMSSLEIWKTAGRRWRAAILDAVNYPSSCSTACQESQRVLLLISETADHGSHSANIDDVIRRWGTEHRGLHAGVLAVEINLLDTLRGNTILTASEQTEMHEGPTCCAVAAGGAACARIAPSIASLSVESTKCSIRKGFDARMTTSTITCTAVIC